MLLGTPHRGCNGVRTGYCANEWAPQREDAKGATDLKSVMVPREGAGAIKLRLDVSRVARVARFANDLTEDEREQLMEFLAAERKARRASARGGGAGDAYTCTTQLCAILALLDKARENDDGDFSLFLASSVNGTEAMEAPDRSQRRCRQLFVDKRVRLCEVASIACACWRCAGGGGLASAGSMAKRARAAGALGRHRTHLCSTWKESDSREGRATESRGGAPDWPAASQRHQKDVLGMLGADGRRSALVPAACPELGFDPVISES
jgi:hypothetical protein